MRVGFMGLGKLGLPVALAMEQFGHQVMGYDPDSRVEQTLKTRRLPYRELGAQELLDHTKIKLVSVSEVVRHSEIVFVPIQTPHHEMYEGITRIPATRADFNYSFLVKGVADLASTALTQRKRIIVAIISTVLPGTIDREIRPLLNEYTRLVYTPQFIAMGTTIDDFLNPEFVPLGVDDEEAAATLIKFYATLHDAPVFKTDIKTAEMIKVSYNTFITMKTVLANTWMEICHKLGANADDLVGALSLATVRLLSPKYLRGGMGDGGGCHPRDNIALSHLAQKLNLSHDIFADLMQAREDQTEWLAQEVAECAKNNSLPLILMGKTFKEETNLVVGSPGILLSNLLDEYGVAHEAWDPYIDEPLEWGPAVYAITTKHEQFAAFPFPKGSIVVDPHRYIPDQEGVRVVRIGEGDVL